MSHLLRVPFLLSRKYVTRLPLAGLWQLWELLSLGCFLFKALFPLVFAMEAKNMLGITLLKYISAPSLRCLPMCPQFFIPLQPLLPECWNCKFLNQEQARLLSHSSER